MLGMIRRWLWSRRRSIFRFWDGRRKRRVDPMTVYRGLLAHPRFNWDVHPALIDDDNEAVSMEASLITADAVREVFGVPSVEAGGLTEGECVFLLAGFADYLTDLKKSTSLTPTSPESTGPDRSVGTESTTSVRSGCT